MHQPERTERIAAASQLRRNDVGVRHSVRGRSQGQVSHGVEYRGGG
jgi:hypothetical protein